MSNTRAQEAGCEERQLRKTNGPAGIATRAVQTTPTPTQHSVRPPQSSRLRIPPPRTLLSRRRTAGSANPRESRRSAYPARCLLRADPLPRCRSSRKSGRPSFCIPSLLLLRSRRTLLWFNAMICQVCPFFGHGGDPQYYRNSSTGPLFAHAALRQCAQAG